MSLMQRLFNFRGGLHLDYRKEMSTRHPIRVAPVPPQLVLPLSQHAGAPAKAVVKVGERVLRGQTIAEPDGFVSVPIHASSSGTVIAIESRPIPHVSGLAAPCIVIDTDGRDESLATPEWAPVEDFHALDAKALRETVRRAGIAGLGGAGFPSFIKLSPGRAVETLIINGAECEPYISCDQQLMAERADEIIGGVQVILQAIGAPHCLIGVEDNKPNAITALRAAAAHDERIQVRVVPTRYPQGGEKQLIQTLTGREVPSEGLPLDIGLVVHNPGTARAVFRAVRYAEPLTARIVTVTGGAVAQPQNFEARIGTAMQFLIEQAGGYVQAPGRLLMGGPMMGFALSSDALPIIKSTNCILAAAPGELRPDDATSPGAMPCIRCGACQEACPVNLLPQQLYWHARGAEFDKARALKLFDCIECGCCAQVCPSHIPLVQYYRHAKTEIWAEDREKRKADAARERHEARQARLEREEREKEEARARKKAQLAARKAAADPGEAPPAASVTPTVGTDDPVATAIAAAKAKKAAAAGAATGDDPVARAIAAAKAKKAADANRPDVAAADDPVARAIAAAKAKKAAAEAGPEGEASLEKPRKTPPSDDAVAAAIAAAQARKAAKAAGAEPAGTPVANDPVARAIAAAQAKKAAAEQAPNDGADPVAQAIAAAKARKAAKEAAAAPTSDDPVAKAIADAKAKKAAKEAAAIEINDDPVARAVAAAKAKKAAKDAAAAADDEDPGARAIAAAKAKKAAREAADKPDGDN